MEDRKSKPTEDHLGIEMDVLEGEDRSTRQFSSFPGSARRLNSNCRSPSIEVDGRQVTGNVSLIQDVEEARCGSDIISIDDDLLINCSSGTRTSGQGIKYKESIELFHHDMLDTQVSSRDIEAALDESYFLERHELQFRRHSGQVEKQLHSNREKSTLNSQVVGRGNKHGSETTSDESYFLANYELQLERFSEQDANHQPTKPDATQAFLHSNKRKSDLGAKENHTTLGEPIGVDGEYWRRTFLNKDNVTSEESSLEQEVPEAKRQWYRSRKTRPQYNCPPPSRNLDFWFKALAVIMTVITIILIIVLCLYLLSILSQQRL